MEEMEESNKEDGILPEVNEKAGRGREFPFRFFDKRVQRKRR